MHLKYLTFTASFLIFFGSCIPQKSEQKDEQIRVEEPDTENGTDSTINALRGNSSMSQVPTTPNSVLLTGLADHRLITVYKAKGKSSASRDVYYSYDGYEGNEYEHFMPGIDLLYGYNLFNVAHYDMKSGKMNYMFPQPVLIRTLYYPSTEQDSINKLPVNRDYYLVSAYDEDTNKDTLINRRDLRRFYHFDAGCTARTRLLPADYSVIRSQYDALNDAMYLFARQDVNKNGREERDEPVHVFWIDMKAPKAAMRML